MICDSALKKNKFMNFLEIILIGLILSSDSFSAAVAMGMRRFTVKDALKFAFSSAGSEALFAFIGSVAGAKIIARFEAVDHWIAFTLLVLVALHMAYEGFEDLIGKEKKAETKEKFHGFAKILLVSFATSLDAFGVGIGLGISGESITPYIISIGFWAFVATVAGLYLAKIISRKFGSIVSLIGAAVLIGIAFMMLKI